MVYKKVFQGKLVKITPTETLELVVYTTLVVNAINNKCVIILLIIIHHLWCIMAFTKNKRWIVFSRRNIFRITILNKPCFRYYLYFNKYNIIRTITYLLVGTIQFIIA